MVEKHDTQLQWPSVFDPLRQFGHRIADWLSPASDASASKDAYRISVELPGVAEKDIDLQIDDGVMTVKGEKRSEREERGDDWYFSERQYGSFSRSFRLPADADPAGADAQLKDGVLTVTIKRKSEETSATRRVAVRRG